MFHLAPNSHTARRQGKCLRPWLWRPLVLLGLVLWGWALRPTGAMQITDYHPAVHDRFATGFPAYPQPNSESSFVGANLDWSAVAWSLNSHSNFWHKGHAMLSPQHFLAAAHYEIPTSGEATTGISLLDRLGMVASRDGVTGLLNLQHGLLLTNYEQTAYDLAIGRLPAPVVSPSRVARLPVLDLYSTSNSTTTTPYLGLSILHYGRGATLTSSPRTAPASVVGVFNNGGDARQTTLTTARSVVQLEVGDSGSPLLHIWSSPQGTSELALLGLNSSINATLNFLSMFAHPWPMATAAAHLAADGYALRVVGYPAHTWQGIITTNITDRRAWGLSAPASAPSDLYVVFDAAVAGQQGQVFLNAAHHLRGLYFRETLAPGDGFVFSGNATLTVGRGGVVNYDGDRQHFTAPVALGAHQLWLAGSGGVALANLALNHYLLEMVSPAPSLISGTITGNGSLALSGGTLVLSGSSAFSGPTWVHEGELQVSGSLASSSMLHLAPAGRVRGSGTLPPLAGGGTVAPGTSVLSAPSLQPSEGMDFALVFTTETPDLSNRPNSGNSVLWLTQSAPFSAALTPANRVQLFLPTAALGTHLQFRGGFFVETNADFSAQLTEAAWEILIPHPAGEVWENGQAYTVYPGPARLVVTTEPHSFTAHSTTVSGRLAVFSFRPATFTEWIEQVAPAELPAEDRQPSADPTGQNLPNLLAFALGVNPFTQAALSPETFPTVQMENEEMVFRFRRNVLAAEVHFQVEVSTDLQEWATWTETPRVVEELVDSQGQVQICEVRLPWPENGSRLFARLRVVLP